MKLWLPHKMATGDRMWADVVYGFCLILNGLVVVLSLGRMHWNLSGDWLMWRAEVGLAKRMKMLAEEAKPKKPLEPPW